MSLKNSHFLGLMIVLAVAGAGHGYWSKRWSAGTPQDRGHDLLSTVTDDVGSWRPGDFFELDPRNLPPKTVTASRRFKAVDSGRTAVVSVTSGNPGETAAHTPDICYLGVGYRPKAPPSKQTIAIGDGRSAVFYTADFEKSTAAGTDRIRVRWAWSADGEWKAPDYPRLAFIQTAVLYKLYIVHPITDDDDLTKNDPYRTFAGDLARQLGEKIRK